ncbi:MAG: methyl-accepting chemotaxis protein [Pseudomonadota bacterium]
MHSEEELETAIKQLRRGRGLAVTAGAIGVTLATATDPAERSEHAAFLSEFIVRFSEVMKSVSTMPLVRNAGSEGDAALKEIMGFADELSRIDTSGEFAALTRDFAAELTMRARTATLPAFYFFIRKFESERALIHERRADNLRSQTLKLEKMFGEVEDIGRMIHLISLNASVEAARAGGESGRSFKVIADEIRSLAAKSSELIDTTRAALREDDPRTVAAHD